MALIRPIASGAHLTEETLTIPSTSIDGAGTKMVTLTAAGNIVYYGITRAKFNNYGATMTVDSVSGNTIVIKAVNAGGNAQSFEATVKVWHE